MISVLVQGFLLAMMSGPAEGAMPAASPVLPLDAGYRQMYNLEFEQAHRTFRQWQQGHPDDPFGYTSEAAAFLFSEFDRLGILQSEFFVDDKQFKKSDRPAPDVASKKGFERALTQSERLADRILINSPEDANALFSKVLNLGLRADYLALIEKRYLASIGYMKDGGKLAEKLLAVHPTNYDAYLAVGVENYILGLRPAPVRWVLRLYGSKTDKAQGLRNLRLTAEKGHYLLPFARLLLAVAALRDKDRDQARVLLAGLARDFPKNGLYTRELARLQ